MASLLSPADRKWAEDQIGAYAKKRETYEALAGHLGRILLSGVKPITYNAIVQGRAKSLASFAGKIQLKKSKYSDPVNQLTDLCGTRIIVQTRSEVAAVCDYVRSNFIIDEDNSEDASTRLGTKEFGYRSWHFIVLLDPNTTYPVTVPKEFYGLKAEVQVKTLLEHAWADIYHDRVYKGEFKLPAKWEREVSTHAALLEETDSSFSRVLDAFERYESSYQGFMTPDEIANEIELLEIVLRAEPRNTGVAHKIGQLATRRGDWEKAVTTMKPLASLSYYPLLRDLGNALCEDAGNDTSKPGYREGLSYLERACEESNRRNVDTLTTFAGKLRPADPGKADRLCEEAFRLDHTDPYALTCYLTNEILRKKDTSIASYLRPLIEQSIERCREQIEVRMNIPWAWYSMATFVLLLGRTGEALAAYARGVNESSDIWMANSTLAAVRKLSAQRQVAGQMPELKLAEQLLEMKIAMRSGRGTGSIRRFTSNDKPKLTEPVTIVCGATDCGRTSSPAGMSNFINLSFEGYRGSIISGGTKCGICMHVGNLQTLYGADINTIGYLPKGKSALSFGTYNDLRYTDADEFGALEPLTYWADLICSGCDPANVKVIVINGGNVTSAEAKLALAFGAKVAVVNGSGRAADELLADPLWRSLPNLLSIPEDHLTINAFVDSFTCSISGRQLTSLARSVHNSHAKTRYEELKATNHTFSDWAKTSDDFKKASIEHVKHAERKLSKIGHKLEHAGGAPIVPVVLTPEEIEILSEMEHARWNVERALAGWRWGQKRDETSKTTPYLVPWKDLPEHVKDYDRNMVKRISELMAQAGYRVVKL